MSKMIRVKRGLDSSRQQYLLELGELVWTTDGLEMWVGDGTTLGGIKLTGSIEDLFIPKASRGVADGVASLDATGKVPANQIPAIAISEVWVVNSEAQQLALPAETGDVAVRTDLNQTYIHNGGMSSSMSDWTLMAVPTDVVQSVNGQTGSVMLSLGDINTVNLTGGVAPMDLLQWNGSDWLPVASSDIGRTTFTSLDDTPNSTITKDGQFVQVDEGNNQLVYTDVIDGGSYTGTPTSTLRAPTTMSRPTTARVQSPRAVAAKRVVKRPNIKRL